MKNKGSGPALVSCITIILYFCDDNKVQRGLRHQPSTYMYECLLLIIMAVEMGVQSAEHLLIAEMLCSNSLSLPTIHPSQYSRFLLKYFLAFLQSRESVCVFVCVLLITNTHTFTHMRLL